LPQGGATSTQAVNSRIEYMKTSIHITKSNLVSGVGFGAYKEAEIKYRDNVIYETNDPHNLYLRILSEVGVLGGFSFLFLLFVSSSSASSFFKNSSSAGSFSIKNLSKDS
jgi:O-antigen ligase